MSITVNIVSNLAENKGFAQKVARSPVALENEIALSLEQVGERATEKFLLSTLGAIDRLIHELATRNELARKEGDAWVAIAPKVEAIKERERYNALGVQHSITGLVTHLKRAWEGAYRLPRDCRKVLDWLQSLGLFSRRNAGAGKGRPVRDRRGAIERFTQEATRFARVSLGGLLAAFRVVYRRLAERAHSVLPRHLGLVACKLYEAYYGKRFHAIARRSPRWLWRKHLRLEAKYGVAGQFVQAPGPSCLVAVGDRLYKPAARLEHLDAAIEVGTGRLVYRQITDWHEPGGEKPPRLVPPYRSGLDDLREAIERSGVPFLVDRYGEVGRVLDFADGGDEAWVLVAPLRYPASHGEWIRLRSSEFAVQWWEGEQPRDRQEFPDGIDAVYLF